MAKLFGYPINLEEEGGGGSSINAEASRSGTQPDGEGTSLSAGLPQRESDPYSRFLDSGSSAPMDSEPDPNNSFIDFFDRESYEIDTVGDVDIRGGFYDAMEVEEEVELGLGIGVALSGELRGDSVSGDKETDSGRVEVGTDLTPVEDYYDLEGSMGLDPFEDDLFCEEEAMLVVELENPQNDFTWESEPLHGSPFSPEELEEEEEEEDEEGEEEEDTQEEEEEEEGDELRTALDQNTESQFLSPVMSLDTLAEGFYEESAEDILMDAMEGSSLMEIEAEFFLAMFPELGESTTHGDYYDDVFAQQPFNQEPPPPPPIMGSRPASKRVVDDLPVVEITSEDLGSGNIVCAICIGDVVVEERVTRLPCWHYYHGECILPWLGVKNTCPVCRFELPTDDL